MAPALLTGVALLANALSLPPTRVAATAAHTHTNMRSGKRQAVAIHRMGSKGESDHSTTEDAASPQTAKNRLNIPLQENIHRGILRGLRNISDTP